MNGIFQKRVRAASVAGWWTLLIGALFLTLQWIIFLWITSARPQWPMLIWGDGLSWDSIRIIWLWGAAIFKLCLWLLALVVVWLTLWARQLRRMDSAS